MSFFARAWRELRQGPTREDGEDALRRLRAHRVPASASLASVAGIAVGSEVLEIRKQESTAESDTSVDELGTASADVVHVVRGVYESIPSADARSHLLSLASRAARRAIVLHVPVVDDGTHLGRALVDAPRRILRRVGVRAPEPGDRFGPVGYAHCFFDEEPLACELATAGLVITGRHDFTFVAERAADHPDVMAEKADRFALEIARTLREVRYAERKRLSELPEHAVTSMRVRGSKKKQRGPIGRARLRRAIGWVDAVMPKGGNCYRRVLLELGLDGGAARETIVFGLDVGKTGHVAFDGHEERTFDVAFAMPAHGAAATSTHRHAFRPDDRRPA
ncbi:hypothetical protein AKJ09_09877 [Labilithrix luteola]|uniref:Uncharacterized protein n=1 Tax=Labilithrix luteola TaxID=1391654 RepID=A0A0K1QBV0_9BACT|nr:hypothetical protein [Labilithrix luteola]AKV03214.1 hypothetical protein AKJ09_09877 [Labilithrix luteola]